MNPENFHPVLQAFLAGLFTWLLTALGATAVLLRRQFPPRLLCAMLGFAAGVMIAASFWSLLAPAIAISEQRPGPSWLPATIGFLLGAAAIRLADWLLPHLHPGLRKSEVEGVPTHWRRSTLLVLAITLHNIPEGLAIGVAFGAAALGTDFALGSTFAAAVALTIGIGLQNFPEGIAVAMPLRANGVSRRKSFFYGQLSAIVEPVAAVIGAAVVLLVTPLLPYTLAFAAGAMIYVVVEELIPNSQQMQDSDLATTGAILGFATMMVLDVALG